MAQYKIHRLPLIKLVHEYPQPMFMSPILEPTVTYAYIFYIEGPKQRILIDSGVSSENMFKRKLPGDHVAFPADALKQVGLKPEDIDLIICTHLHFDHNEQGHLYKKARFIIQKAELDSAMNPHPVESPIYGDKKAYEDLDFKIINGDSRVIDGIKILSTPGHTAGSQSIMVDTCKGKIIIAGQCTNRYNFYPQEADSRSPMPVIPPSAHVNVNQAYDSLLKIKKEADLVIPLHDTVSEYDVLG
jgi:N-acyl homoserine lactone hydrolase